MAKLKYDSLVKAVREVIRSLVFKEVEVETTDPEQAYARFPAREPASFREGWLPD